ncbi:plasmid mobilization relaxosome protein MobC [Streptomyces sp. GKU 257-1]|nr:plasmid mobilization relaxosome protein MobC [Streptomyces sp. GKU 257-1]
MNLSLSDAEFEILQQAASLAGLAVGAYAARASLAVAMGDVMPIPVDERQLLQAHADARAQVRRAGNNLNQIAKVLNSDQSATAAQIEAVASRADAAVMRLDSATVELMEGRR